MFVRVVIVLLFSVHLYTDIYGQECHVKECGTGSSYGPLRLGPKPCPQGQSVTRSQSGHLRFSGRG